MVWEQLFGGVEEQSPLVGAMSEVYLYLTSNRTVVRIQPRVIKWRSQDSHIGDKSGQVVWGQLTELPSGVMGTGSEKFIFI